MLVRFAPRANVRKLCASIRNAPGLTRCRLKHRGAFRHAAVNEIHHAHGHEHRSNENEPKALKVLEPAAAALGPRSGRRAPRQLPPEICCRDEFTAMKAPRLPGSGMADIHRPPHLACSIGYQPVAHRRCSRRRASAFHGLRIPGKD